MLNGVETDFKQVVFVAKFIFKLRASRVIKCIMGNSNNTLKMADTDNFPEIIDDIRKRTRLLHNLYTVKYIVHFYVNPMESSHDRSTH